MKNTVRRDAARSAGGITLVELLVVVAILMLLMAVVTPRMQPALEERRLREAARMLNVYCGSARNRAMETGRPCGIRIHRDGNRPCAAVIDQVAVPEPYAGDTLGALASVTTYTIEPDNEGNPNKHKLTIQIQGGFNKKLVKPGDRIQLNHQGPAYTITSVDDAAIDAEVDARDVCQLPWPGKVGLVPWPNNDTSEAVPFSILRRPVKIPPTPLRLPTDVVIDLQYSGTDSDFAWLNTESTVSITFSPSGAIDRVYWTREEKEDETGDAVSEEDKERFSPCAERLYFLIGSRTGVPRQNPDGGGDPGGDDPDPGGVDLTAGQPRNWEDTTNLWVTLNPRTGLVTTANVAAYTYDQTTGECEKDETGRPGDIIGSRYYARLTETKGGQ